MLVVLVGSVLLSGCATTEMVRPVDIDGQCVPVVCPLGIIDYLVEPKAARLEGEELTLLVETSNWSSSGTLERFVNVELMDLGGVTTEVTGLGEVRGTIAASAPLSDGFLLVMSPKRSEFDWWVELVRLQR